MSAVPFQACRAHLFKEAGGLRYNSHMDQNEGVLRHPADCPCLFEGNKVTEKKDKCTGECLRDREGTCWTDIMK